MQASPLHHPRICFENLQFWYRFFFFIEYNRVTVCISLQKQPCFYYKIAQYIFNIFQYVIPFQIHGVSLCVSTNRSAWCSSICCWVWNEIIIKIIVSLTKAKKGPWLIVSRLCKPNKEVGLRMDKWMVVLNYGMDVLTTIA